MPLQESSHLTRTSSRKESLSHKVQGIASQLQDQLVELLFPFLLLTINNDICSLKYTLFTHKEHNGMAMMRQKVNLVF